MTVRRTSPSADVTVIGFVIDLLWAERVISTQCAHRSSRCQASEHEATSKLEAASQTLKLASVPCGDA
jgi:hypothetical protein